MRIITLVRKEEKDEDEKVVREQQVVIPLYVEFNDKLDREDLLNKHREKTDTMGIKDTKEVEIVKVGPLDPV